MALRKPIPNGRRGVLQEMWRTFRLSAPDSPCVALRVTGTRVFCGWHPYMLWLADVHYVTGKQATPAARGTIARYLPACGIRGLGFRVQCLGYPVLGVHKPCRV